MHVAPSTHHKKLAFRMNSSKWIETFKSNQTFSLNEMVSYEPPFHIESQELLMSLYDKWFSWLLDLESELSQVDQCDGTVRQQIKIATEQLKNTLLSEWQVKTSAQHLLWQRVYLNALDAFVSQISAISQPDPETVFSYCAEQLLGFMQHTLLIMHEIDTIMNQPNKRHFVSLDDYGCAVYRQQGKDLVSARLQAYRHNIEIDQLGEWEVKHYNNIDVPNDMHCQLQSILDQQP
ncbi:hypothetical protein J8Z24_21720 (plasmid) [Pseudoalteromonas sp. SCSIO 43201]|uniref:hypothetical protein n=1 Tax=Pseudoalteromonas sp. SCSIO 43201 TaxID=2822842 RepID=UPI002074F487|nr:hypothetical protein [Pseudoalteromonas sp. SCSIO 43201]USD31131.1 hypothetical protein J8Z24_21720 [Pseudoalteromonas sp. SCSIO 43201]